MPSFFARLDRLYALEGDGATNGPEYQARDR